MADANNSLRIIVGSLAVGGTERHLTQIIPRLKKKGVDITVLVLSDQLELAPQLIKAGIKVKACDGLFSNSHKNWFKILSNISKKLAFLYRDFRQDQSSLTHFFLPEAYILGMAAAFLANLKAIKIMSRRSLNEYQTRRKFMGWIEPKLYRHTIAILGNSQAVVDQLVNEEKVPPSQVNLIYNGIDLAPFVQTRPRATVRKELGLPENALVLISVANLIPYKGHLDLLQSLSLIKSKLPNPWHLLCVGKDQGILADLKNFVDHHGLTQNILWLGSRLDIPDLLKAADIGLLCSHEEGFSNAILEGMAAGLPMIVTDIGGNPEAVLHKKNGLVSSPKNPVALSANILTLALDNQLRAQYGEAGKERVTSHFSLDQCVERYLALYRQFWKEQNIVT